MSVPPSPAERVSRSMPVSDSNERTQLLGQRERRVGDEHDGAADLARRRCRCSRRPSARLAESPPIVLQPVTASSRARAAAAVRARARAVFIVDSLSPVLTGSGSEGLRSPALSARWRAPLSVCFALYADRHAEPTPPAARGAIPRLRASTRPRLASPPSARGVERLARRPSTGPCRPGRCAASTAGSPVRVRGARRLPGARGHAAARRAGAHPLLPARRRLHVAASTPSTSATPPGWPGRSRRGSSCPTTRSRPSTPGATPTTRWSTLAARWADEPGGIVLAGDSAGGGLALALARVDARPRAHPRDATSCCTPRGST